MHGLYGDTHIHYSLKELKNTHIVNLDKLWEGDSLQRTINGNDQDTGKQLIGRKFGGGFLVHVLFWYLCLIWFLFVLMLVFWERERQRVGGKKRGT